MIVTNPSTGAATDRYYYHANRLGSVIALANQAGALTDRYVYTPYGVETPLNTSGNPFRYTGRRYDPESKLYYYRARYYWPEIGRFLETDPIGCADQMNLYAYVGNNPLNATDPTGRQAQSAPNPAPTQPEPWKPNTTPPPDAPGRGDAANQGSRGPRFNQHIIGALTAVQVGNELNAIAHQSYWAETINDERGEWVALVRFYDTQHYRETHSGPWGSSWMYAADIQGMTLSEIRSAYGIPDGLLPGPGGSTTDPGGFNDMGMVKIAWMYRENLSNQGMTRTRSALPWPPGVLPWAVRSPGGSEEILLNFWGTGRLRLDVDVPSSELFEE